MTIETLTTRKIIKIILIFYPIYAFLSGALVFGFHKSHISSYFEDNPVERFLGSQESQDRVVLIEDRTYSGIARINLIEQAESTLDIAYYTINEGASADIFFGKLLEAADRGVKVRILIDGILHNLYGPLSVMRYVINNHPNIELKFYEPFTLLKPWTWNNRLHDKILIIDNQVGMIGGRNIGDRYFLDQEIAGEIVYDRDVVIINTDMDKNSDSVINQMSSYFDLIWNHKFSRYPRIKSVKYQKRKGKEKREQLTAYIQKISNKYPEYFELDIDWLALSVPTKKMTLIHNPIQRLNKEPWVWGEIIRLMKTAKQMIFVQSPYVIPNRKMLDYVDNGTINFEKLIILTNSVASSQNNAAMTGYRKYRKKIVDSKAQVYEYHGPGSIHGKTGIIDNRLSLVGSFNVDPRSTFLSTETMVVIDSKEFAEILEDKLEELFKQSLAVGKDYSYQDNHFVEEKKLSIGRAIFLRILGIITYCFDFML